MKCRSLGGGKAFRADADTLHWFFYNAVHLRQASSFTEAALSLVHFIGSAGSIEPGTDSLMERVKDSSEKIGSCLSARMRICNNPRSAS